MMKMLVTFTNLEFYEVELEVPDDFDPDRDRNDLYEAINNDGMMGPGNLAGGHLEITSIEVKGSP